MKSPLLTPIITRIVITGIVLLVSSPILFSQPDTWTQKADFGGVARIHAAGFSLGNKGYIGTGYDGSGYQKDFWEYDPSSNIWSQKADFGGSARFAAVGFSIGNKGYIGTGYSDGSFNKDFWEYDPATNNWVQKADVGGTVRYWAVGFSIGTKGYIGTGINGSYKKDFWEYDPSTDTWEQKADFGGTARHRAVGISIGNRAYIGTGYDDNYKKDFWEYDPSADTWVQKADFGGTGRPGAIGFSIALKGYIGMGDDGASFKKDFWEYDPSTDTWVQKTDFGGTKRNEAVGFSIGSKGYIGTGYEDGGSFKMDFWEYMPCVVSTTFYRDADNDTYGDLNSTMQACSAPSGYVSDNTDCNDQDAAIHPGTSEVCNGIDDNCDGAIDEGVQNTFYQDADGDGYGNTAISILACSVPAGYVDNNTDCNDANSTIHPGATEICNGIDDDCNGSVDDVIPVLNPNTWLQKADFGGTGRYRAVGFSIGTRGYIGTGWDGIAGMPTKDFWEYDPTANIWSQKADFGGSARLSAIGFVVGNKGYIGTGDDGMSGNTNDFWEYDPSSNTWSKKADFPGPARRTAVGVSIGDKGYIGTGGTGMNGTPLKDFWEYDPSTNAWTQKADFGGSARRNATGFGINNKGYIGTGDDGISGNTNDFWEYDPSSNTWLQKADFGGTARNDARGFSIDSKGYLGTGQTNGGKKKDFWGYDPSINAWLQKADFGGSARESVTCFSIGSKGYIGTGAADDNFKKDFWEYTPGTTSIFYRDADNDTYGDPNNTVQACSAPSGYVSNNTDCNDQNEAVYSGATEICNGIDDDCDGLADEGPQTTFYQDADADGYGNALVSTLACTAPAGYVNDSTDCNDANNAVHPSATETCNGIDDNCNGQVDEPVFTLNCSGPVIVIDQNVTIDFNPSTPVYSGDPDLLPYFTWDKTGPTPNTWKAIFNLGASKLLIKNGATVTVLTVPTSSNNRYSPGILILSECDIEIENGGHIVLNSMNRNAGDITIEASGNITINGEIRNEVSGTNNLPGAILVKSLGGSLSVGQTGLVHILGTTDGGKTISLFTYGAGNNPGNITISGLVKSFAFNSTGDSVNRPNIRVASFNGSITVNANSNEPLYDEFQESGSRFDIYGGLLSWTRNNVRPGTVEVQAKGDIIVNGHGTDPTGPARTSFGAIAAVSTGNMSPGGLVDVRSLDRNIVGNNRAFDVSGRNRLPINYAAIKLAAKSNITLNRPGTNNTFNPVVNASSTNTGDKGGKNELRSFGGNITIGPNAQVSAAVPAGNNSVQGANLLTACTGVTNNGIITPAPVVSTDCSQTTPAEIFSICPVLNMARYRIVKIDDSSGVSNKMQGAFRIYPNPSEGKITIQFNTANPGKYLLKVIDVTGSIVFLKAIKLSKGENLYELNLTYMPGGIYILVLENAAWRGYNKIILH